MYGDDQQAHSLLDREARLAVCQFCRTNDQAIAWLTAFCVTGVAAGLSYVPLQEQTGPAEGSTFFLVFLGYWAQFIAGGLWLLLKRSWRHGEWTRSMVGALLLSSAFSCASESLSYLAKIQGGIRLFTVVHSSVTLLACLSAALVLRARVLPFQWLGGLLVFGGMLATAIPSSGSLTDGVGDPSGPAALPNLPLGLLFSALGCIGIALSYPVAELVFDLARRHGAAPPSADMACLCASSFSVLALSGWTLGYTLPRWHSTVEAPIENSPDPSITWAVVTYAAHTAIVGAHALAFWKCISMLGTVPTAVSIGAQQAGYLFFANLLFCLDGSGQRTTHCFVQSGASAWGKAQKVLAFVLCCVGCGVYVMGSSWRGTRGERSSLAERIGHSRSGRGAKAATAAASDLAVPQPSEQPPA